VTVRELIAELQKRDPDADAVATWEGVFRRLTPESIYTSPRGHVVIDADHNCYRGRIEGGDLNPPPPDSPYWDKPSWE